MLFRSVKLLDEHHSIKTTITTPLRATGWLVLGVKVHIFTPSALSLVFVQPSIILAFVLVTVACWHLRWRPSYWRPRWHLSSLAFALASIALAFASLLLAYHTVCVHVTISTTIKYRVSN